uniref:COX assembly mitochondrial protein 2 homolog n=1 Tax=Cucumis melo TaxID=3656 RepID=A0A9I9EDE5_CUCME
MIFSRRPSFYQGASLRAKIFKENPFGESTQNQMHQTTTHKSHCNNHHKLIDKNINVTSTVLKTSRKQIHIRPVSYELLRNSTSIEYREHVTIRSQLGILPLLKHGIHNQPVSHASFFFLFFSPNFLSFSSFPTILPLLPFPTIFPFLPKSVPFSPVAGPLSHFPPPTLTSASLTPTHTTELQVLTPPKSSTVAGNFIAEYASSSNFAQASDYVDEDMFFQGLLLPIYIIEQFQKCHIDHPVGKFFGECTDLKIKLDQCFRQEFQWLENLNDSSRVWKLRDRYDIVNTKLVDCEVMLSNPAVWVRKFDIYKGCLDGNVVFECLKTGDRLGKATEWHRLKALLLVNSDRSSKPYISTRMHCCPSIASATTSVTVPSSHLEDLYSTTWRNLDSLNSAFFLQPSNPRPHCHHHLIQLEYCCWKAMFWNIHSPLAEWIDAALHQLETP